MHFFNIATNLTNGPFMVGYENDPTDFYLKGEIVGDKPLVSCRILDFKGHLLLSMERNKISHREKELRIKKNANEYAIFVDDGQILLKIVTRDEKESGKLKIDDREIQIKPVYEWLNDIRK